MRSKNVLLKIFWKTEQAVNNLNLTRGPNSEKKNPTFLETKTGCDVLSLELFSQPLICMSAVGAHEDKSTQKYTPT